MSQNVQELINKIKQDGLQTAQAKAKEIEAAAEKQAQEVLARAKSQAEKITADAQSRQQQIEASSRESLKQAARDTLLSVKQEVIALLDKIAARSVRESLTPEQTAALISEVTKGFFAEQSDGKGVEVGLSEESRSRLEQGFLEKLQKEIKAGITIRTADDLTGGFTISFDEGRSCFDFSEAALAEYLGKYVNEYVGKLLKS